MDQETRQEFNKLHENQNALTDDVRGLAKDVNGLTQNMQGLTKDVNSLTKDVDGLTQNTQGLTKVVDGLTQNMQSLTKDVGDLTQKFGVLTESVAKLADYTQQGFQEMREEFTKVYARMDTLDERIDHVRDHLQEYLRQGFDAMDNRFGVNEKTLVELERQTGELHRKLDELADDSVQKEQLHKVRSELEEELKEVSDRVSGLEQQLKFR